MDQPTHRKVAKAAEVFEDREGPEMAITSDDEFDQGEEADQEDVDGGFEHVVDQESISPSNGGTRTKRRFIGKPLFRSQQQAYFDSFRDLFNQEHGSLSTLRSLCLGMRLRASAAHFRALAWSLFLDLLPPNLSEWAGLVRSRRERYGILKSALTADERRVDSSNPDVNNPLSQDEKSPWHKFFADGELKSEILKDVERTNHENPLFKKAIVRAMMMHILFVYAKKYPLLAYKQGMHECLAILILVQYDCCKEYSKITKLKIGDDGSDDVSLDVKTAIKVICDPKHLEADSYFLFEKFMEKMWDWYFVGETSVRPITPGMVALDRRPFEVGPDLGLCNAAKRLQSMWDNILQLHDQELYNHLREISILPTTFGTNWTKLLFSRQLSEYLSIWDALMATNFSLVDYIVAAMVISIRGLLLDGDAIKCNTLLVSKYPSSVDIRYVLAKALHMQDPLLHPQPSKSPFKFSLPFLQDISSVKRRKGQQQQQAKEKPDESEGSSKKLFNFSIDPVPVGMLEADQRKMVDLSGPSPHEHKVGEGQFEFLGGEPSCSLNYDELKEEVLVWRAQLGQSLGELEKALDNSKVGHKRDVRVAMGHMETLFHAMGTVVKTPRSPTVPAVALDALEINDTDLASPALK